MKRKVTLSLSPNTVADLEQKKRKRKTSMSKEVERLVKDDKEAPKEGEHSGFYDLAGSFADWFTEEDFEADDRAGEELRKTKAYQHLVEQRKTKKKSA
ncbi:MAG: hypothetical protein RBT71_08245 [Flavobacteriales bacterium]|jgi:hypothetical protein|nr:hypothetical protein [Flavobacteriales bacterium]